MGNILLINLRTKFVILTLWFVQLLFSQQLKIYQGVYQIGQEKGTASYQYYENENYERILQGNFKYSDKNYLITGQYHNNKRVGQWKFIMIASEIDFFGIQDPGFKETISGSYKDGEMSGTWIWNRVENKTNKITLDSRANFDKGKFVGVFSYSDKKGPLSINGSFDNNGFLDGTWTVKYKIGDIPYTVIRKYKRGVYYFNIEKNETDGSISNKYDSSKFVLSLYSNYDSINNIAVVNNKKFAIEQMENSDERYYDYEDKFYLGFIQWECVNDSKCYGSKEPRVHSVGSMIPIHLLVSQNKIIDL